MSYFLIQKQVVGVGRCAMQVYGRTEVYLYIQTNTTFIDYNNKHKNITLNGRGSFIFRQTSDVHLLEDAYTAATHSGLQRIRSTPKYSAFRHFLLAFFMSIFTILKIKNLIIKSNSTFPLHLRKLPVKQKSYHIIIRCSQILPVIFFFK